ncbi:MULTISPECIES: ATP-binding protein [Catenuloplanes]|uniref:Orc1-like AAA ATPase domain-containing protein n=1 Tax=Catenuloplanes niger TaxID=587534 RepID=A0AAE4CRZ4_9ACTN|nr:ATP-binding protein [Catenuloplanes niger]MDR7320653.1 hypothetical protein [Catenuloplanes niger]
MSTTGAATAQIADLLRGQRQRSFVGRDEQIETFRAALAAPGVLFVHGAGGVGKSALLDAFAHHAAAEGRAVLRADTRHPLPAPEPGGQPVLLIDNYERLGRPDGWMREDYLPSLPAGSLVVLAGRDAPGPGWTADPAWRRLTTVMPLGNLPPEPARAYLSAEGIAPDHVTRLLDISHGHPLTLSMLVDAVRRGARPRTLADLPDLVGELLTRVVGTVPTPRHRTALEVCAHTPVTTEDLLRSVVGTDAAELFAWLRSLPFVEAGRYGLHPHDVVRDALDADLRWRDPDGYTAMAATLAAAQLERLRVTVDEDERFALMERGILLGAARTRFTSCHHPPPVLGVRADRLREHDSAPIVAMTSAWQGAEQAALAAYWLDHQPGAFRVFRTPSGEPAGYAACLELTEHDLGTDPGADTMWRWAHHNSPAQPGEKIRAWRFFVDRDHGQRPCPSSTLFIAAQTLDNMLLDDTAWTMVGAYAQAHEWTEMMAGGFAFAQVTGFTVGGTHYPVFAHDWRRAGVDAWRRQTRERQQGAPPRPAADGIALSRPVFAEAVRRALRDLHTPDRLRDNPLLASRTVRARLHEGQTPADGVRDLLRTAAGALRPDHGDLIDRTFLTPAKSQERVAAELHLSFSTYRRHRDRAVADITDWLWEREIHTLATPDGPHPSGARP